MTALVFFAAFLSSLLGASGTLPAYRDSGDLVSAIHTLGIAHPPGYALYVILGKAWVTLFPVGNVAYRVNAMSAFFAALAAVGVYAWSRRRTSLLVAGGLTLLVATSPAWLSLSRVAEMYTLSGALAFLIYAALDHPDPRGAIIAALALGLGLSVHPTLILLLPLFIVRGQAVLRTPVIGAFVLGTLVFLYLPIRASQDPLLNWGDPSSWRNFWRVVTRADYGGLKLHPTESVLAWTPASLWAQSCYFVTLFQAQVGKVGLLIGVLGIGARFRRSALAPASLGLLAAWTLSGPAFVILSNLPLQDPTTPAILEPYLLIPVILWVPFLASGVDLAHEAFSRRAWVPALVLGGVLAVKPWAWASQRHDFYAYDYARNVLRMLPDHAVLYDPDDTTHFSIQTLQLLEGRRPDVTLLSFFRTRWGYEQLRRRAPDLLPPVPLNNSDELTRVLWAYGARKRPFYAELPVKLTPIPYRVEGLVYAAKPDGNVGSTTETRRRARALLEGSVERGDSLVSSHTDFFVRHVLDYRASASCNLGLEYAAAKDWASAVELYQDALRRNPAMSAAWNNLGIVDFERGRYAEANANFERGLAVDPKNELLQKNALFAGQKMAKNL